MSLSEFSSQWLHTAVASWLEPLVRRFEEAWQRGERPALDAYLPRDAEPRRIALVELIHLELELRLKAGEAARVEEYLTRYPELADEPQAVLALLQTEWRMRARGEPRLSAAEYQQRFPQFAHELDAALGTLSTDARPTWPATLSAHTDGATLTSGGELPRLPGYEIEKELGRGSMGVVYKARHLKLNRVVALKMLLYAEQADDSERRRFQAEAQALARLKHPNIVPIYEIGEHQGRPFFALEYLEGGTLAERLKRQPLSVEEAVKLTATLARAIHAAHEAHIVHRDLKPANILLTSDGTAKISDFSLAKQLDAETLRTQSGAIFGTPAYMAPEQASGRSKAIGPAADIHALGAILYELLTGQPPFRGLTLLDVLQQVQSTEPISLRRLTPKLPRDLETICHKCLRKAPEARYRTALELAQDLERFLRREPIRARPVPVWERGLKWVRRHPAAAAFLAILWLAVASAAGAWVQFTAYLHQALAERTQELQQERQQREQELRRELYFADMQQVARLCQLGELSSCFELLQSHQPQEGEAEQRDFAWRYYRHWCDRRRAKIDAHQGAVRCLAFSPNGQTLVSGGDDGTIKLWGLVRGELQGTLGAGGSAVVSLAFAEDATLVVVRDDGSVQRWDVARRQPLAWPGGKAEAGHRLVVERERHALSPHGRWLVTAASANALHVWDTVQGIKLPPLEGYHGHVRQLVFAWDERLLATANDQGDVVLWDVMARQERTRIGKRRPAAALAFAPRAPLLAVGDGSEGVTLWETGSGRQMGEWVRQRSPLRLLAFAPDDSKLAAATVDGSIEVWDVAHRQMLANLRGHKGEIRCLAFTAEGDLLASGGADGTIQLWDAQVSASPSRLRLPLDPAGPMAFAPDGQCLAVVGLDHTLHLLDLATGQVTATLRSRLGGWHDVVFAPRGREVAVAGEDGAVHLWDPTSGAERLLTGHEEAVTCVAYSPQGEWLVSGGADRQVKVWKMPEGRWERTLSDHSGPITKLAFSRDGRQLATASADKTVRLWDVPSFQRQRVLSLSRKVFDVAFSPQGERLLTCSEGRGLTFWDVRSGKELPPTGNPYKPLIEHVAPSPVGNQLAVANDQEVWILEMPERDLRNVRLRLLHEGIPDEARWIAFAPDGKMLAVNRRGGPLELWDMTGQWVREPRAQSLPAILSLAFAPTGETLVTGSRASEGRCMFLQKQFWGTGEVFGHTLPESVGDFVRLWDVPSFTPRSQKMLDQVQTITGHPLVAFAPNGKLLASGAEDGSVSLWDVAAGKRRSRFFINPRAAAYLGIVELGQQFFPVKPEWGGWAVRALAFAPDSRLVAASGAEGPILLFDTLSDRERARLPGKHAEISCLAFSPDGTMLAVNNREVIELWEVTGEGQPVLYRQLRGHTMPVRSLAFSRQGPLLASGSEEGEIRLWNWVGDETSRLLRGHTGRVASLTFSGDGKLLASASWDGTVRLWHRDTGRELATLMHSTYRLHAVAFSPDGQLLVASGERANGRSDIYFWKAAP